MNEEAVQTINPSGLMQVPTSQQQPSGHVASQSQSPRINLSGAYNAEPLKPVECQIPIDNSYTNKSFSGLEANSLENPETIGCLQPDPSGMRMAATGPSSEAEKRNGGEPDKIGVYYHEYTPLRLANEKYIPPAFPDKRTTLKRKNRGVVTKEGSEPFSNGKTSLKPSKKPRTEQKRDRGKKKRGAPRKTVLQDRLLREHALANSSPPPEEASGLEHYVSSDEGYFDPRFNSQQDLQRLSCIHVTELDPIGPDIRPKSSDCCTDYIPFYNKPKNFMGSGNQFWMTSAVIACQDYSYMEQMIKSGEIQTALHDLKQIASLEEQMWLLILLRLIASCKTQGHLLLYAAGDIYNFLLDVLTQSDEHFIFPLKKRIMSDSRGYEYYLIMAMAAHTRPLQTSADSFDFRREVLYRNHAKLMLTAYGGSAKSNHEDFIESLSDDLASYYESLTLHNMAIEVFIDIAKYGLFNIFASTHMNARWAKAFSQFIVKSSFRPSIPFLVQLVYQAPVAVAERLDRSIKRHKGVLQYLMLTLENILDVEFFKLPNKRRISYGHVILASQCAKSLILMLKAGRYNPTLLPFEIYKDIRKPKVQNIVVQYVLAAPFCGNLLSSDDHKELYDVSWSFLHSISYSFPMMMHTIINFACDKETPLCLRGHAAMFSGTVIAMTKYKVTKRELYHIRNTVKEYALAAHSIDARQLRLELAFRLGVFLEPSKYGIKSGNTSVKHGLNSNSIFSSYEFKKTSTPEVILSDPKEIFIDAIKLLEDDEVVELDLSMQDHVIDDNLHGENMKRSHRIDNDGDDEDNEDDEDSEEDYESDENQDSDDINNSSSEDDNIYYGAEDDENIGSDTYTDSASSDTDED